MRIFVYDHAGHPFQVQLSRRLAARGHSVVHAFCGRLQTPRGKLCKSNQDPDHFEIFPAPLSKPFERYHPLKRIIQENRLGRQLLKKIALFHPDVVLSANTPILTQSLLLKYCRCKKIRFVFWLQDILGKGIQQSVGRKIPGLGTWIGTYFIRKEYALLRKSDAVIAISEDFLHVLSRAGAADDKIHVIHNWAPLEELPLTSKSNAWSRAHNLENSFNFIYSGTIGMKHNPELLVALAIHFKNHRDVNIVVITEGLGADYLKKRKEACQLDPLLIFPFQPYEMLPQVFGTADVLIGLLETDAGTFSVPSKVLTYLCAKKPLLLAVPGSNLAAKIISSNQAGWVCSPEDIDSFLSGAERLYEDNEYRESLASNGYRYAKNTFDIETITDKFEKILSGKQE